MYSGCLTEHAGAEELCAIDAVGGVMGAGVDATGIAAFFDAVVEIADGGLAALLELAGHRILDFDGMKGDVAVGAVLGAFAAADAVILDDDGEAAGAVDGVDGAADEAFGITTTAATGGDEEFIEPQPIANEP